MPPPHAERAQWRPHWLGWGGGFELSDPAKPPLEHGLTATEGRSARHIHCRMDWTGARVTLWQLSREKSLIAKRSKMKGNSGHTSKANFGGDICEFESSRPGQPVRSLLFDFRLCANCRHSRGLCWCARVSGGKFRTFGSGLVALAAPVSARHFPISVSECPRTVGDWLEGGNATRGETKAREPAGGCTVRPVLHAWQSLAKPVKYAMEGLLSWGRKTLDHRMAIFRQVNKERTAARGREIGVDRRALDHHGSHGRRKAEEGKCGARYAWRWNGWHGRYGLLIPPSTEMTKARDSSGPLFLCRSHGRSGCSTRFGVVRRLPSC